MIYFAARAVGTPFKDQGRDFSGLDCWGLIILAYRELYGLEIPDPDVSALDSQAAAEHFERESRVWLEVPPGKEQPGDVALFRNGRFVSHAGIVAKPGLMLHVDRGIDTVVTTYASGTWKTRLAGIYRHAERT